ncbi:unnamed protein product [Parascedosporium putredinis]|uniref:MFS transporter n=1 Tax=Parascedosporium putredinis TaxID=1442378 RepID=A0A9P1MDA7_9PEZI|nr:unnamed protein product [Parascedosporium putredinis]CAI7999326.1 unnamed protein product [Parascedosporium putredinis]
MGFFASFNNFLVFATYLYQDFQGLSTLQTTLRFLPTGVVGALVALAVALTLHRVPTQHMLLFGTACVSLASLLFALPIPPHFLLRLRPPAMALSALAPHDQALGAALLNAVGQVGRAIGLALATTVQAAVVARERGVPIREAGDILPWDHASLLGLRAANWTTFSLGVCSFLVVAVAFRNTGIVGKAPSPPAAEPVNPPRPSSRACTEPSA